MANKPSVEVPNIKLITDQPVPGSEESDLLGMGPFARILAGVALGTEGPFNIGVYGGWGVGKTSMLQVTRELIEKQTEQPHVVTVWFNAWQYEREEHPLFPLIAAIIEAAEKKASECETTGDKLCAKLTRLGSSLRALTRGMKFSGKVGMPLVGEVGVEFDADKALQAEELIGKQTNPLQGEMLYQSAFEALEEVTKPDKDGPPPKIVIFIDDLDRCLPDKALELLESIKLVLNQKGFIFLLGLDHNIITSYLAKCYRQQYGMRDAAEAERTAGTYLHKIVQLQFDVPHHEQRFPEYVARLLESVKDENIAGIRDVLIAGTEYNPRSLVRLVNNLIIDWTLWEQLFRPEQKKHKWDDRDVLTGMVVTRVMQHHLGFKPARKLALSEDLLAALLDEAAPLAAPGMDLMGMAGALLGTPPSAELEATEPPRGGRTRPGRKVEPVPKGGPGAFPGHRVAAGDEAVTKARADETVMKLLKEHGGKWRQDAILRKLLFDFYKQREASWEAPESQQAVFDRAVRQSLKLKEGVPIGPEQLAEVRRLDLAGDSDFGDAGMPLVSRMIGLQWLNLNARPVSEEGLKHLAALTSLQSLHLNLTQVTSAALEHLARLINLEELSLGGTEVTDEGLEHLANLISLRNLDLYETQVTGAGLVHLSGLNHVQRLSLSGPRVSNEGLERLDSLRTLQELWLGGQGVGDVGLEHVAALTGLQVLHLHGTQVTDDGLKALRGSSKLQHIALPGAQVSGEGLRYLSGLTALQRLDLRDTELSDVGFQHLGKLTSVEDLYLYNARVSDEGLKHLANLKRLRWLHLLGTLASDEGLKHLGTLTSLQGLDLAGTPVSGTGLEAFAEIDTLWYLRASGTHISDESTKYVAALSSLRSLTLSGTAVSDRSLEEFARLTKLELLDVRETGMTDAGANTLRKSLPKCNILWRGPY